MIIMRQLTCSILMASVAFIPEHALSHVSSRENIIVPTYREMFSVIRQTTVQNGAVINVLDGRKKLLIPDTGSISSSDNPAITTTGNGNAIVNAGRMQGVEYGISVTGNDNLVTNSVGGKIVSKHGNVVTAVKFDGNSNTMYNAGLVRVRLRVGNKSIGIAVVGNENQIDVSGRLNALVTQVGNAVGIDSRGSANKITNSGSITAFVARTGNSVGIASKGFPNEISNSGSITASTTGNGKVSGIYYKLTGGVDAPALISNSGSITASTTGNGKVYGLFFARGGSLVNSGTITVSGTAAGSYAVGGSGDITISNSGSIIGSVKNDIPAIHLVNKDNLVDSGFLEFRKGSFIVGEMLLEGDTASISIDGDQANSLHYVFGGDGEIVVDKPQVSGSSPVFYSADNREVAILDTRYLNAGIDALEAMTGNISGLIRSRRFVQDGSRSHVWVSGALSRRANGKSVSFFTANDEIKDFSVGVDGVFFPRLSVGGLVGANMSSMVKSGGNNMPGSYQGESMGMFGAVYAIQRVDRVFLQTAVSGGFLKHNDVRFIQDNTVDNGIDIARSSYHSYWYSPEVTLGVGISAFDWTYTPSVNFRYARQWVDAYGEEGSKSNVTYDRYSISLLSGRAGLAADRQFSSAHLTLRTGFQSFGLIGGRNDVSLSMLDSPEQIFVIHSGSKRGIYGGVDVAMQLSQNASLTLGGEAVYSKDKKMNTHLTAGLDIAF